MNLNNELHQLTGRAEAYLKYQEDLTLAEKLQDRLAGARAGGALSPLAMWSSTARGWRR